MLGVLEPQGQPGGAAPQHREGPHPLGRLAGLFEIRPRSTRGLPEGGVSGKASRAPTDRTRSGLNRPALCPAVARSVDLPHIKRIFFIFPLSFLCSQGCGKPDYSGLVCHFL